MAAAKKKFIIEEKATFRKRLIWQSRSKRAINLTGYMVRMQIRSIADESSAVLMELTQANNRIIVTPLTGTIDLFISAVDTNLLTWSEAVYDIVITAPDGTVIRLLEGKIVVSQGVTQAV
jgi:hypothetical protein